MQSTIWPHVEEDIMLIDNVKYLNRVGALLKDMDAFIKRKEESRNETFRGQSQY